LLSNCALRRTMLDDKGLQHVSKKSARTLVLAIVNLQEGYPAPRALFAPSNCRTNTSVACALQWSTVALTRPTKVPLPIPACACCENMRACAHARVTTQSHVLCVCMCVCICVCLRVNTHLHRCCSKVRRLGLERRHIGRRAIRSVDTAKVRLTVPRIRTIILPVIPNEERGSNQRAGKKHARKKLALCVVGE
jgi:hypothetical protein